MVIPQLLCSAPRKEVLSEGCPESQPQATWLQQCVTLPHRRFSGWPCCSWVGKKILEVLARRQKWLGKQVRPTEGQEEKESTAITPERKQQGMVIHKEHMQQVFARDEAEPSTPGCRNSMVNCVAQKQGVLCPLTELQKVAPFAPERQHLPLSFYIPLSLYIGKEM